MYEAGYIPAVVDKYKPAEYYLNNVAGTLALLTVMKDSGVHRIVFSSTCAVYGEPEIVPIAEDEKKESINTYGRTKYMVEMVLEDFSKAYSLSYVALRYFNACGADPSGEIGERHDPETHIIPRAFMAADGRIDGLTLFGDDYPTYDGTCIRDYIHVNDLAQGEASMAFNLGTGKGTSVKEIIAAVEAITQKKLSVKILPRRQGDPAELVADASLMKEKLGFVTEWNSIEDIIASAWNFYRNQ